MPRLSTVRLISVDCVARSDDEATGSLTEWSPENIVADSWFDCQSTAGMWYNAQAVDVSSSAVTVSFKGYMRDFTETVKLTERYRFANLGSKATGNRGALIRLKPTRFHIRVHQGACLLLRLRKQTLLH